jgi:hypothetical protein
MRDEIVLVSSSSDRDEDRYEIPKKMGEKRDEEEGRDKREIPNTGVIQI